jgi:hypothetical protein
MVEVPGENHLSILWSDVAAREMLAWLDGICGVTRAAPVTLDDPRRRTAGVGLLLAVLLLAGIGQALGRLAPAPPPQPEAGGLGGLAALVVASLATMPLLATGSPFTFLGLDVGDVTIAHMTLTGVAWLGALALLGRLDWAGWRPVFGRSVATGLLAFLAVYVLFVPINIAFHRLTPTPERLAVQLLATALLLPYFVAFELGIRRGGTVRATLTALAGRALVVGVAVVGVRVGVMPPVVAIMLPTFVVLFVLFEVVAVPVYATARNVVAIATLEAAWLAWSIAVAMPIRW